MSFPHLAALFTCFMLVYLPLTVYADPGPRAYADARAPVPKEEVAALTKKLEALSAKKAWKEAGELASKKLGAEWCADTIALPFRTFAALGVIARRSKKSELALTCTLRSFFAADTRTTHGQAFFELSLLVDAMSSEEFIAFQKRAYDFPSRGCDQRSACCYELNDFIKVIRSFNARFNGEAPDLKNFPTQPKELERLRKLSAKRLLGLAYVNNPSPALAKRLSARKSPDSEWYVDAKSLIASTTSLLPSRLEPAHVASSHEEARTWLLEHARKRTFNKSATSKIDASGDKTVSQGGLSVTQILIGHIMDEYCDAPYMTTHNLIVHMKGSSDHLVFLDPQDGYYANGCGGYGDEYSIDSPKFEARVAASAPLFFVSSSTSSYINGGICDASGRSSGQVIYCSTDEDKTARCLWWEHSKSWSQGLDSSPIVTPSFSFKKGLSDFNTSAHSASMQALIAPIANASFMEVYEAIPKLQEQVRAWFTAP